MKSAYLFKLLQPDDWGVLCAAILYDFDQRKWVLLVKGDQRFPAGAMAWTEHRSVKAAQKDFERTYKRIRGLDIFDMFQPAEWIKVDIKADKIKGTFLKFGGKWIPPIFF